MKNKRLEPYLEEALKIANQEVKGGVSSLDIRERPYTEVQNQGYVQYKAKGKLLDCGRSEVALYVRERLDNLIDGLTQRGILQKGNYNFARIVERRFGELYFQVRGPSGGKKPKLPKHIQNKPQGPDPKAEIAPSIRSLVDHYEQKGIDCASEEVGGEFDHSSVASSDVGDVDTLSIKSGMSSMSHVSSMTNTKFAAVGHMKMPAPRHGYANSFVQKQPGYGAAPSVTDSETTI